MSVHYFSNDTIAAIATSLAGDGGIGIIRISGKDALALAQKIATGLEKPVPRYAHRVFIKNVRNGQTIDDGVAIFFPEGESFTGEECVELQLHGGRFLLQTILSLLIENGRCRMALPGEFSFRAVKNGKISLNSAQVIKQVIEAKSLFEVQAARQKLSEERLAEFRDIAEKIRALLAQTELSIDFIDQDVEVLTKNQMAKDLDALVARVAELLKKSTLARKVADGIPVTLTGEPNAGKSTIFNMLLSQERAIVSEEAGTTRDIITEEIRIDPYFIRLADTAGLREAESAIEKKGVERAQELLKNSELILLVLDGEKDLKTLKKQIVEFSSVTSQTILVLNKVDLASPEVKDYFEGQNSVRVCALEQKGATELLTTIARHLKKRFISAENAFLPTEFQMQMLKGCLSQLISVQELIRNRGLQNPEIISAELRSAATALSDLVGETTPDSILSKIFSEFCIGK